MKYNHSEVLAKEAAKQSNALIFLQKVGYMAMQATLGH